MKESVYNFNILENYIAEFSETIVDEIIKNNYIDRKELITLMNTRLSLAIDGCVNLQVDDLFKQREVLVIKYNDPNIKPGDHNKIASQLAELNYKLRNINRVKLTFKDKNEYRALKRYLFEKYGKEVFNDFYENYLNKL